MALLFIAIAIFAGGNLYRLIKILRMPAHLRWELYPLPHGPRDKQLYGGSYFEDTDWWTKPAEASRMGELRFMLAEIFFLKGIWKRHRSLWPWSWLLHIGLYALVFATFLGIGAAFAAKPAIVAGGALITTLRAVSWAGVCCGLAGTLGLFVLRAMSPRLRPYTSRAAFLNLAIIVAIFATGLAALIQEPATAENMVGVLAALLGIREMPALPAIAAAHLGIVALFLAYFPFTHMTHAYMKFFTYHSVRWDDAPAVTDFRRQQSIAESMERTVSWAAPHIASDGTKTWSDVVSKRSDVEQES